MRVRRSCSLTRRMRRPLPEGEAKNWSRAKIAIWCNAF
jgi:hypothetical protein